MSSFAGAKREWDGKRKEIANGVAAGERRLTIEEIVAKARANSGLSADDTMALAVEETRRHREGR